MTLNLPLMENNITKQDLEAVINFLKQDPSPILGPARSVLSVGPKSFGFGEHVVTVGRGAVRSGSDEQG